MEKISLTNTSLWIIHRKTVFKLRNCVRTCDKTEKSCQPKKHTRFSWVPFADQPVSKLCCARCLCLNHVLSSQPWIPEELHISDNQNLQYDMIWCTETSTQPKNKYRMRKKHAFGTSSEVSQTLQAQALLMPFYQARSERDIWRRKRRMTAQLSKTVFQWRLHKPRRLRLSLHGFCRKGESKAGSKRHSFHGKNLRSDWSAWLGPLHTHTPWWTEGPSPNTTSCIGKGRISFEPKGWSPRWFAWIQPGAVGVRGWLESPWTSTYVQ